MAERLLWFWLLVLLPAGGHLVVTLLFGTCVDLFAASLAFGRYEGGVNLLDEYFEGENLSTGFVCRFACGEADVDSKDCGGAGAVIGGFRRRSRCCS